MRLFILLFVVSATIYSADALFGDWRGLGENGNKLYRSIGDLIFGKIDTEDKAEQKPNNQKQLNQPMADNSDQKTKEDIKTAQTTKPKEPKGNPTEPNQQETTENSEQRVTNPEQSTDINETSEKSRVRRDINRATQPPLPPILKSITDNQHRGRTTDAFQNMHEDWKIIEETAQDGIPFFMDIAELFENNLADRKRRAVDEEDFKTIQSCVIDAVKEIISCVTKTSDESFEATGDVGDAKDIGKCIVKAIMDFVLCTAK